MVAIKDFGMPSCCANCDMCLPCALNEGLCHITQHTIGDIYDKRPSDCPLVEIEEKWIPVVNVDDSPFDNLLAEMRGTQ